MSDIIILAHRPGNFSDECALIDSQQRHVQFHSSNNKSATIKLDSKADAEAEVIAVGTAPDYSYSIPRRIHNIIDAEPLPLPAPDLKSYHLQARLAYESAENLWAPPKKLLSISV